MSPWDRFCALLPFHGVCDRKIDAADKIVFTLRDLITQKNRRIQELERDKAFHDYLLECLDEAGIVVEKVACKLTRDDPFSSWDYQITIDTLKRARKLKINRRKEA